MTQPDVLADAPQNPESTETPAIDYDALAEAPRLSPPSSRGR